MFPSRKSNRRRSRRQNRLRTVERLEERQLMDAGGFVDVDQGIITLHGTSGNDVAEVRYTDDGAKIAVSMNGRTEVFDRSTVKGVQFHGGNGDDSYTNYTEISTTAFGGGGDDVLVGGSGDDQLNGNAANDVLVGNGGDDQLVGGGGGDTLVGGNGNDRLEGNTGRDTLRGNAGDDTLSGGVEDDLLIGGSGDDWLSGGDGNDNLQGNTGNDELDGDSGDDILGGGSGNDIVKGGDGNDLLLGGDGADQLFGDAGDDQVRGNSGNDFLFGDIGNDLVLGGGGIDIFGTSADETDRLHDFEARKDKLLPVGSDVTKAAVRNDGTVIVLSGGDLYANGVMITDVASTSQNNARSPSQNNAPSPTVTTGLVRVGPTHPGIVNFEVTSDGVLWAVEENGKLWSLEGDGNVFQDGVVVRSGVENVLVDKQDRVYVLTRNQSGAGRGNGLERQTDTGWESLDNDVVKFDIGPDGAVYSLGADGELNRDGMKIHGDVDNFLIEGRGQVYVLTKNRFGAGRGNGVERQTETGWEKLDDDVVKFDIRPDGTIYTLGVDGVLQRDGAAIHSDVENFLVDDQGRVYAVTKSISGTGRGNGFERQTGTTWEKLDEDATKFDVRPDGTVYTLGADGELNRDGTAIRRDVADFLFDERGQVYVLTKSASGDGNGFARQTTTGWETLEEDVVKFDIRPDGTIYTLGRDGTLKIDGAKAWTGVREFFFDQSGVLYRKLDESQGNVLERQMADGSWQELHRDVKQFSIRPDGTVYALGSDGSLKIDGELAWTGVAEFFFDSSGMLYRKLDESQGNLFDRQLADGSWQELQRDVKQFSIRPDGTVYALGSDGSLKIDGEPAWTGVKEFFFDQSGVLYRKLDESQGNVLERQMADGSWEELHRDVKQFSIRPGGTVYALGEDGVLKINGKRAANGVEEFFFDEAGLLYHKLDAGQNSVFKRRLANGTWQELHRELKQFSIRPDGTVYALSEDGVLKIDGETASNGVEEIFFDNAGLLYRKLSASRDKVFQRRLADGSWQELQRDVKQFSIRPDGTVYALGSDGSLKIDGQTVWTGIDEFFFDQSGLLYRKWDAGHEGIFERRLADGTWQELQRDMKQFSVRSDGTVYALGNDGSLKIDGQTAWTGVDEIFFDRSGVLYRKLDESHGHVFDRQLADGSWRELHRDVKQFRVLPNGTVLALGKDGSLKVDGESVASDLELFFVTNHGVFGLGADRAIYRLIESDLQKVTSNDVQLMMPAGGELFILRDDRAIYRFDGEEFQESTNNDVKMMLVANGELFIYRDDRTVSKYDGSKFERVGSNIQLMLTDGRALFMLHDNGAVYRYAANKSTKITGEDVQMMLFADGELFVYFDNRTVSKYDGSKFVRIGSNIQLMLTDGRALFMLHDNGAVYRYAADKSVRITGKDVQLMLVSDGDLFIYRNDRTVSKYDGSEFVRVGSNIQLMLTDRRGLFMLHDNRAVYRYAANKSVKITGEDVQMMLVADGDLFIYRDNRTVYKYDGSKFLKISGNIQLMLTDGKALFMLHDNRAVYRYAANKSARITGHDVESMLPAGGDVFIYRDIRTVSKYDSGKFVRIGSNIQLMLTDGKALFMLHDNRAVYRYAANKSVRITGHDVESMLPAGGELFILRGDRSVSKYESGQFKSITGKDVKSMLTAGSTLYILRDNRVVYKYDGSKFAQIAGSVKYMQTAHGELFILSDNRAVYRHDGNTLKGLTGRDVKMMLTAGGDLFILGDNGSIWVYDKKAGYFGKKTGDNVKMMLSTGDHLFILDNFRAVWVYDQKVGYFGKRTGNDVAMMLTAGDNLFILGDNRSVWVFDKKAGYFGLKTGYDVATMVSTGDDLFILGDNRSVWKFDNKVRFFGLITGYDVRSIGTANGNLYIYQDNRAVSEYDGKIFHRITGFNIEEFGYDKNGNLVWEEDGGFWDDFGDIVEDAISNYLPMVFGLFHTPIHGEAMRAIIHGDQFSWSNVGEMALLEAKIGATIAASVATAGAFAPAAEASIAAYVASGAAAGAAGAAADQSVTAWADVIGLRDGYVFDPKAIVRAGVVSGLTAGAGDFIGSRGISDMALRSGVDGLIAVGVNETLLAIEVALGITDGYSLDISRMLEVGARQAIISAALQLVARADARIAAAESYGNYGVYRDASYRSIGKDLYTDIDYALGYKIDELGEAAALVAEVTAEGAVTAGKIVPSVSTRAISSGVKSPISPFSILGPGEATATLWETAASKVAGLNDGTVSGAFAATGGVVWYGVGAGFLTPFALTYDTGVGFYNYFGQAFNPPGWWE